MNDKKGNFGLGAIITGVIGIVVLICMIPVVKEITAPQTNCTENITINEENTSYLFGQQKPICCDATNISVVNLTKPEESFDFWYNVTNCSILMNNSDYDMADITVDWTCTGIDCITGGWNIILWAILVLFCLSAIVFIANIFLKG